MVSSYVNNEKIYIFSNLMKKSGILTAHYKGMGTINSVYFSCDSKLLSA